MRWVMRLLFIFLVIFLTILGAVLFQGGPHHAATPSGSGVALEGAPPKLPHSQLDSQAPSLPHAIKGRGQ